MSGVRKACQGRPVTEGDLAVLAQKVEESVRQTGSSQVDTNEIGLAILGPLRELDEVAYLRFASVYQAFDSLEDFESAIDQLRADHPRRRGTDDWRHRRRRGRRQRARPDSLDGMYPLLFRTVLSRMDPETAHHAAMVVIRMLGIPPFSWVARARHPAGTRARDVTALGLRFESPFGVAAGFDKDVRGAGGCYALGFGHVEVGTLTAIPQDGNPRPRLFRLDPRPRGRQPHGIQQPRRRGGRRAPRRSCAGARSAAVIGVNIGKSRVVDVADATADYVRSATLLAPLADYLVVNVSSPNTPGLRGLQAVETLRPLLEAVRDAAGSTPLLVKIAPDLPDDEVDRDRAARRRSRAGGPDRDEHDDLARRACAPIRRSSPPRGTAGCPARR